MYVNISSQLHFKLIIGIKVMTENTVEYFKSQNEKLNSHITGLSAQVQAFRDTLADANNSINILRTNLILMTNANKASQEELNKSKEQIQKLQDTISALNNEKAELLAKTDAAQISESQSA